MQGVLKGTLHQKIVTLQIGKLMFMLRTKGIIKCFLLPKSYTREPNFKCHLDTYDLIIRNTILKLANTWMLHLVCHPTPVRKYN